MLNAGAVELARGRERHAGGEDVGAGDVAHEDVVARLPAVAEDGELLAGQEAGDEDRDHAGLGLRILPGPEDVGVPHRHALEPAQRAERPGVVLVGELAHAVGTHRKLGGGFGRGNHRRVAVDHAAAAGVDHPLDAALPRALEQVDEAHDVDARVEGGLFDRDAHVDLRRVMVERVELPGGEQPARLGRANVRADEARGLRHVLLVPAREIVEHDDLPTLRQVRLRDVGADEPGPACHQDPPAHASRLAMISPTGDLPREWNRRPAI